MKTQQQKLGRRGEKIAEDFLKKERFKILARNFKTPRWGELDLIAIDKDILVFVEVKTRTGRQKTSPEEAVTPRKLRTLKRAAYFYKSQYPQTPDAFRLDVVAVELTGKELEIRHYRNVPI